DWFRAAHDTIEVDAGEDSRRSRFRVALNTRELSRKDHVRLRTMRAVRSETRWEVEVRVAMDRAETEELRVLQSRDHPEYAALFTGAEPRLETDEVPHLASLIFAPKLQHGVRPFTCARIAETNRLHRSEAERIVAAGGHHFDRQAAFEVRDVLPLVTGINI